MESSLVSQCLAFCQTLANQGKDFSFNLTINSSFSFSLDTRESKVNPTLGKKRTSPSTQRRNARRREEFLRKKLNFSSVSHSASDSLADISPSVTAVETVAATDATSTPAIASTPAQEVNPVANPVPSPSEQQAKSDQVQEEFPLESASPPRKSYSHATAKQEPSQIQFGPRNGLRPNWGRGTKKA